MSAARTQWAEVGWYSNRLPGSQFRRHEAKAGEAGVPVVPHERVEGRPREAAGVQQDLLEGDGRPCRWPPEPGEVVATRSSVDRAPSPSSIHTALATMVLPDE